MRVLVVAEHDNQTLKDSSLHAITAALQFAPACAVLVAGQGCDSVAKTVAEVAGVEKVFVADHAAYAAHLAEAVAPLIATLAEDFTHVLAPATTFGKNVMPRVAGLLGVGQISDITKILDAQTFERPMYAGNAIATVESCDPIKLITVRATAFEAAALGENAAECEPLSYVVDNVQSEFVALAQTKSERPELSTARVVVAGGRALKSEENFKLLETLADTLNAAVGASRAAVDAGFAPNDYQVGQTGKVVAPELYIAVGISGAVQHIAGMKDSKIIVAINQDPEAPIFKIANYGLVGDLFEILPAFVDELNVN